MIMNHAASLNNFVNVNDLSKVPRNCSTECYVDDTKIYVSFNVKDCDDAVAAVNEDLHNIRNWCFQNGSLLNPEKTKLIVYGSWQMLEKLPEFHISLLGKELVPADFVKDLGVTFDKYLTFNEHMINNYCSYANTTELLSCLMKAWFFFIGRQGACYGTF